MKVFSSFCHHARVVAVLAACSAVPAYCATLSISNCLTTAASCVAGTTFTLNETSPAQQLTWTPVSASAPLPGPSVFTLASLGDTLGAGSGSNTAFSLYVTEGTTTLPAFAGTFSSTTDAITFVGTGTNIVGGVTYATESVAGVLVGVQQTVSVNPGKGVLVSGLVVATPEPATFGYVLVGGLGLAGVLRRRRSAR